ncbi:MAG: monovalent cation:proton antiporter-2 (CPA2) family protein [Methylobacter sp.]|nr:monovalent cation:proton antiporter-2 (CPA2) family protein [Methylobacter sp.]
MDNGFLFNTFIFLIATCLVVPLASRFRLGAVLGYLAAGVLIGPFGICLIGNSLQIMSFAEFGVIMMLFMIGLELEPAKLWELRKLIIGLGSLQVCVTSILFTAFGIMLGFDWRVSLACGMALPLSSTAIVLQMLQEKGLLQTSAGESCFAVLLFQDIAVIPILILMPLLAAPGIEPETHQTGWISHLPAYAHTLVIALVIALVIVTGRYLSQYLFGFIAKTNLREVFTAASLALVVGITLLMEVVGVSPGLGAFVAGVVLADSEYKQSLETDIEPFKGLLLGLFFISIGMGMNFSLLTGNPAGLIAAVMALIISKAIILFVLGKVFGLDGPQNALFALALAQGGEFAFVLFQYASGLHVILSEQSAFLTLAVASSMAATPFVMIFNDRFIQPRFMSLLPEREYDTIDESSNSVIIAGYGRFGQIIGRFLKAQGIKTTILEKDPDQIDLLRKFGQKGYFGDASRLDILRNAGADKAILLIVAVDDADKCLEIVRKSKAHFPNLKIFARARNRRHAYELDKAGIDYFRRETFDSSLTMAQEVMKFMGESESDMRYQAIRFMKHDEQTLLTSFKFFEKEPEMINFARQASQEMERILREDIRTDGSHEDLN